MRKEFRVAGQNKDGEWLVKRPNDLMCCGTWKTKEDAQKSCDTWNNRKSSWNAF